MIASHLRRFAPLLIAALLAACGAPDRPTEEASAPAPRLPWFICDSTNTPFVFVATRPNDAGAITLSRHSKEGEAMQAAALIVGTEEGAAGSIYLTLLREGRQVGHIRRHNVTALEDASDATTRPISEIAIDNLIHHCRWLARTRFAGFDTRRSLFITQDHDGYLTYQSFDFSMADEAAALELSNGQRSTVPSLTIEDGEEVESADGSVFRFTREGAVFEASVARAGGARLRILQDGAELQNTEMLSYVTGP